MLVSIFNTRLKELEFDLDAPWSAEYQRAVAKLREQIAVIPTDSFSVKKVYPKIEEAWSDGFWLHLNQKKLDFLKLQVGPLLRYAPATDVEAATFTSKVERLKWQKRASKDMTATTESIAEDVSRLPDFVVNDAAFKPLVELGASPAKLVEASQDELNRLMDALAPQMKNRRAQPNAFLLLDLADSIDLRGYIMLRDGKEQVYVKEYRERVEKRIRELVENHPAIQAIQRGETPNEVFTQEHNYNANQINFMRAVQNVFCNTVIFNARICTKIRFHVLVMTPWIVGSRHAKWMRCWRLRTSWQRRGRGHPAQQ